MMAQKKEPTSLSERVRKYLTKDMQFRYSFEA